MKKTTLRSRPVDSPGIHIADTASPKLTAIDPQAAMSAAIEQIYRAMPEIVDAVIIKAKAGSYLHANFLFNFAGGANREPGDDEDEDDDQGSLVDFLMKRLDADATSEPHSLKSKEEEKKPVNGH